MTRHQFFPACPPFVNTVYGVTRRKRLQEVIRSSKKLQGVTKGNRGIQEVTGGFKEVTEWLQVVTGGSSCLLYTSPSPRDGLLSRMPSSA